MALSILEEAVDKEVRATENLFENRKARTGLQCRPR